MREEDDAQFDDFGDEPDAPPPPPFPSHVALPMPAWGMMLPWAGTPQDVEEEDGEAVDDEQGGQEEDEDEELTEEEANRRWLRGEVDSFFTMN